MSQAGHNQLASGYSGAQALVKICGPAAILAASAGLVASTAECKSCKPRWPGPRRSVSSVRREDRDCPSGARVYCHVLPSGILASMRTKAKTRVRRASATIRRNLPKVRAARQCATVPKPAEPAIMVSMAKNLEALRALARE